MNTMVGADMDDDGFSMVEVIVAIAIVGVTLLALLGSGITAVRASSLARLNAQAADLMSAEIEKLRALPYASVVHVTSDATLATAPGVSGTPATFGGETLDVRTTGAVTSARSTATIGRTVFTVYRYVTIANGSTVTASGLPSLRRATVRVDWTQRDRTRTRSMSTLLTNTRRGLPLPNFRFDYNGPGSLESGKWTITRAPGSQADFGLRLTNLGARDAWDLTASTSGWTFYHDANQNGVWDGPLTEPALASTGGAVAPDTGLLEPNSPSFFIVASRMTATSETGTQNTVFSATSVAQPTYAAKTVDTALVLTATSSPSPSPTPTSSGAPVPCTPGAVAKSGTISTTNPTPPQTFTNLTLRLFNGAGAIDGDSSTHATSSMGSSGSTAPGDCNYSTDLQSSQAGRVTTASSPGRWEYGSTASTDEYRGNALATVWVQCTQASADVIPTLTFSVLSKSGGADTLRGAATTVDLDCSTSAFKPVSAYVFMGEASGNQAAFKVAPGTADRLVLKVTPNQFVRLLYEGPDTGAAALVIPTK